MAIFSEEKAKELSVRIAWACIMRDCGFLARACAGQALRFHRTILRGYAYKNLWWTRR